MGNRPSANIFTSTYNLVRSTGILDLRLFRRAFLGFYFLYKRCYEDPFWELARCRPELFAGGDVLDIGANIGYTTWVFSRVVAPAAKVYAFEPDAASFAMLQETVRRKKIADRAEIFNMAVGSADGSLEFWHNDEHSADHRVVTEQFKASRGAGAKTTTVAVTTVDNFAIAQNLRKISFIKIDVQGYELAVCEGMRRTLGKFPGACIAFEYAPDGMRELGFEPVGLLDFFRTGGYQLHILTRAGTILAPDNLAIETASRDKGYVDVLCSKKILVVP